MQPPFRRRSLMSTIFFVRHSGNRLFSRRARISRLSLPFSFKLFLHNGFNIWLGKRKKVSFGKRNYGVVFSSFSFMLLYIQFFIHGLVWGGLLGEEGFHSDYWFCVWIDTFLIA